MQMQTPQLTELSADDQFMAGLADGGGNDSAPPQDASPPEPADNAAADSVDTTETASQPDDQDDTLSALPEDIRNRYQELESANQTLQRELAKARNDHASMTGKLRPLQQKLAALESQQQAAPAAADIPATPQTADELDALLDTEEFREWSKTFPEEAKVWKANQRAIIKVAGQLAEQIAERRVRQVEQQIRSRVDPVLSRVEQQHAVAERESRIAELQAAHPDWQQHSESDAFSEWFNTVYLPALPDEIQGRFQDPNVVAKALSEPKYAARVLTEFKRDTGLTHAAPAQQQGTQPTAPSKPNPRLALSAAPNVQAPPPKPRVSLDQLTPEQQFQAGLNAPD